MTEQNQPQATNDKIQAEKHGGNTIISTDNSFDISSLV